MEVFETSIFRKSLRCAPRIKKLFDEKKKSIRADRVAKPPKSGKLRVLKIQADKEAMIQTHEAIGSDPSYAEEAKVYDRLFVKEHGRAAIRAEG